MDELAHLLGGDGGGGVAAGYVGGAVAGGEDLEDGGFDGLGFLREAGGVAEGPWRR